ncbi:MAG: sulfite exporter TauE/SafE family protein [Pseudomonadota bacterium]
MPHIDLLSGTVIFVAIALGGIMKGATGAGVPVVAVPVMAAFFDVRLAVIIMSVPNLLSNLWQLRTYWDDRLRGAFLWQFALSGAGGAVAGTYVLASVPEEALLVTVAAAVVAYIALRLLRPDFQLSRTAAGRAVVPTGFVAGTLQGMAGISAPVSVSFLNAMRLERRTFIASISAFFAAMSLAQVPALYAAGLLTPPLLGLSALALVPIFLFLPVGAWVARYLSPKGFDRLVLLLLGVLAIRLIWSAVV